MSKSHDASEARFDHYSQRDADLVRWRFDRGYVAELARRRYALMFGGARRVLDVGCGVGEAARWAGGAEYVGVELSSALVRRGAVCDDRRLVVGDATRLPFADGVFDRVACMGVLHHLPPGALEPALGEMARVLEPGGRAVIIEPNPWNPYQHVFALLRAPERGILRISPRRLRRAMAATAGLEIERAEFDHTMPLPSLATFLLRRLRWVTGPRATRLLESMHRWAVRLRPTPMQSHTLWVLRKT